MKSISIRTLMAAVIVVGIGLAALKNANELWVEGLLLTPFAALGTTVLGAFLQRGRERARCAGFALVGGSYVALAFVPWPGDTVRPLLGTTHLLDYVHTEWIGPRRNTQLTAGLQAVVSDGLAVLDSSRASTNAPRPRIRPRYFARGIANYDHFQRVGHSLFALLAGVMGGIIAVWVYGRRERGDARSTGLGESRTPTSFRTSAPKTDASAIPPRGPA